MAPPQEVRMEYENIRLTMDGGVATLTLDRPDAANAMDLPTMKELMHAAIRCDEDRGVRAVIVTGNGRFFSAGGDLAGFADAGESMGELLKEMTTYFHAAISRLARMDAPVIAAVNGVAAGAGLSFVAACDLAVAAESAMFTSAYTAASLTPDGSSTWFVPRLIGMRRAMELMLTNRRLAAAEAHEWGLVNLVVPDDELMDSVNEMASTFAVGGTLAFGGVKRLLQTSFTESLETQMELEARTIAAMSHTSDGREGVDAFLNKRRPVFRAE
jgi:2-(1,2-epoxy-1,2-dihydrophenyl)acetyl-CoA isomerase